jgi:hypothetical protein
VRIFQYSAAATAACVLLAVTCANASILTGPFANSANGHSYYLLNQNTWNASEAEAVTLGGHLATVNDLQENTFIFNTLSGWVPAAPQHRWLWIGLYEENGIEGNWKWIGGQPYGFTNWAPGQPDNNLVDEDFAGLSLSYAPLGLWHDVSETNTGNDVGWGVVEVPEPASIVPACAVVSLIPFWRRRTRSH